MTYIHKHRARAIKDIPFQGCTRPDHCRPEAHGNITVVSTCPCGATRMNNINRGFIERGEWTK